MYPYRETGRFEHLQGNTLAAVQGDLTALLLLERKCRIGLRGDSLTWLHRI